MTDQWQPDNLPILLMNRSLLTNTRSKPIQVGQARLTAQDKDALVALDIADTSGWQSRYAVETEDAWLKELTELPYQISYYFPSNKHNNRTGGGTYGAGNLTDRVLYEHLCQAFNGGKRFIEDYFFSVFKRRMQPKYAVAVKTLKQAIADEAQVRRQQHKAYLSNFNVWTSPLVAKIFVALAKETKQDIVRSLQTGAIPLAKSHLSDRTLQARKKLGIASGAIFYATGRLIGSIVVSVILLDKQTGTELGVEVA